MKQICSESDLPYVLHKYANVCSNLNYYSVKRSLYINDQFLKRKKKMKYNIHIYT